MWMVWICSLCGILGSVITFAFGSWTESLTFLLVAMGVDYVSGVSASLKEGKGLSSAFGSWGLARKGLMLLVILLAHRIDVLMDTNGMTMGAAIFFYIANELISITENYGRLGLPLPDRIRKIIEVLKDK
ncbi:phage holin family protein [Paenibacillus sp. GSMTC-2017]|uniref:phage holin family protein n=1 Tax=Paenibacillus sp. GSMTC-2017 TaxID=2794350 RepID=UPI0018D6B36E|nr:phage holin family protein [Paenibacillus sp. GSMTC-2017]MBH5318256.1 phage holin family protein [Paenibacillus sp. GSMTC-2017]